MSSIMWYLYEFARKSFIGGFADAKSKQDIMEKPDRFRDFPQVIEENCISCGACTQSCPSPHAIKLVRGSDETHSEGLVYPLINTRACIRCGFCAEVCPTEPKTIICGENHLIQYEYNVVPSKRQYVIDDFLCIKCKKCMSTCPAMAIYEKNNEFVVDQSKCVSCGNCLDVCPIKGAMKGFFIDNLENQKELINYVVNTLEEFVESKEEELINLPPEKTLRLTIPFSKIFKGALEILSDEEIALDIVENAVDRLKIKTITWDESKCAHCRLCVDECPTGAINYNEDTKEVKRDPNKCLRCSICYQTCPFNVVRYFTANFIIDDEKDEKDILVIIKESIVNK